jgi:hypothetical protein
MLQELNRMPIARTQARAQKQNEERNNLEWIQNSVISSFHPQFQRKSLDHVLSSQPDAQVKSLINGMPKCRCTASPDDIFRSQFLVVFHDNVCMEARKLKAKEDQFSQA